MADSEGVKGIRNPYTGKPRDLLQRFIHVRNNFAEKTEIRDEEEDDVELSLGLSLNGRFGVNPERAKNLIRSSSISNLMISSEESRGDSEGALPRTCSLPAETGEDWMKRKELQSKRRMEAKRKRLEKTKSGRVVRGRINSDEILVDDGSTNCLGVPIIKNEEVSTRIRADSKGSGGSIASQGSGGSSGVSDPEILPTQVSGTLPPKVKKPNPTRGSTTGGAVVRNRPANKVPVAPKKGNEELVKSMMVDMPCVSTRGDGPNGKRIEGFLYRYGKGEEVKIVCVCHGSFLSPAEFIKHAGCNDVAHPLKRIVVCSSTSSFL